MPYHNQFRPVKIFWYLWWWLRSFIPKMFLIRGHAKRTQRWKCIAKFNCPGANVTNSVGSREINLFASTPVNVDNLRTISLSIDLSSQFLPSSISDATVRRGCFLHRYISYDRQRQYANLWLLCRSFGTRTRTTDVWVITWVTHSLVLVDGCCQLPIDIHQRKIRQSMVNKKQFTWIRICVNATNALGELKDLKTRCLGCEGLR